MSPIALAALLSIIPTEPAAVDNGLGVSVTGVLVQDDEGRTWQIARIALGRSARAAGARRVVSFEMASCTGETLAAVARDGSQTDRDACWRALARENTALSSANASESTQTDLQAVVFGPASPSAADREQAARVLPELVAAVVAGGPAAPEIERRLAAYGFGTPGAQLRSVPRTRRPELLTILGEHEDGRAFGLLARAALESAVEAERTAAVRALADYPDDAVRRLSAALRDPSPVTRRNAAEALGGQDHRAVRALWAALVELNVSPAEDAGVADLVRLLVEARNGELRREIQRLRALASAELERGDLTAAKTTLESLEDTDREAWNAARALRARRHVLLAAEALSSDGGVEDRGRMAAEELAAAQGLDPRARGLVDLALRLGRFLLDAGYPASASRVLGPYEESDSRVAALRTRALRDEVRRRVEAGDEAGARARLTQLLQEGRKDLADDLDDTYGIRASGAWFAPASVGLFLCTCIGFAVRRERRRRRFEFQLIETEQDRGQFHHGPYR
jgi:hypothetical protein